MLSTCFQRWGIRIDDLEYFLHLDIEFRVFFFFFINCYYLNVVMNFHFNTRVVERDLNS